MWWSILVGELALGSGLAGGGVEGVGEVAHAVGGAFEADAP